MGKLAFFTLVLWFQVCMAVPASKDGEDPEEMSFFWDAKERVQTTTEIVRDFAQMYYADHIKPTTDPYVQWASDTVASIRDRISNRWSHY
ncbi:hypothetical protein AAFF_G00126260 [Aldrovandia affinis]|uniref:Uncharacterized protein n=1 Tax=Aldrovandia affinis TaxID=143900 RepID=A0AAD7RRF1_9TELE|nr:hypothetical protein AAFF_G00126260 [Aldrovandia affinis]